MAKTKKGRQTNNSSGRKRAPPTRRLAEADEAKEKVVEIEEIDISSLADDDPTKKRVAAGNALTTLLPDSSSEDEAMSAQDNTPRKGEDKKRQRFAKETEIIDIQNDDDSSSYQVGPSPIRLTDRMDAESLDSERMVTIADILGEGPEETMEFPEPLVITKDCRYTCQVKVTPCDNPAKHIAEKSVAFFKWMQNKIGKELSIATWDDAAEKHRVYAKAQQLPKTSETSAWTAIWGTWVNIKPQQEGTAYLKIRFTTKSPDTLTRRLDTLGELRDEITAETGLTISRLPTPCQAVQVGCVGWMFGSNKCINSDDLQKEIRRLINIPPHIRMGISWRAIKLENGRTPPWIDNVQPASALHIDIDWFHAPIYKPLIANLFKKHGTTKPLGLSLRLIPCFSSDEGKNSTTDQRVAAIDMRDKKEYLVKEHLIIIKTPYILNLDQPTKPNGSMTLRRYLKNLHPQGLVAARLILSVDRAWQEGSKDTNIVTTKEFAPQAQDALRNMIPECVHRFGIGAKGWFTREGLLAFKGVEWDPTKNKSVSDRDVEALRVVAEDYFGMGDAWRQKKADSKRPTLRTSNHNNESNKEATAGDPADSIPTEQGKKQATVENLLAELGNKKNDAPSFGDLYQRQHDGDTAKTSHQNGKDDLSLSSHESDCDQDDVTFANIPDNLPYKTTNEGDVSTAKSSVHYRLQRDKCRELAEKSQEESRQLLETLRMEREELMQAREELEKLRVSTRKTTDSTSLSVAVRGAQRTTLPREKARGNTSNTQTVTPSANRGGTGATADSAGEYT